MWYGDEAGAEETSGEPAHEDKTPDLAPYLRPERPAAEAAEKSGEAGEKDADKPAAEKDDAS